MKLLFRLLLGIFFVVAVFVGVGGIVLRSVLVAPLPTTDGTIQVMGLDAEVEIIRDSNGVPHIYASTTHDLYFAQGYVQAQDRWWQMEFSRYVGQGRIQELVGKNDALMGTDLFIRSIGWYRDAVAELESLSQAELDTLQSFADGVNAYLDSRNMNELALEYRILGLTGIDFEIEPWQPAHSLVWTKVVAWDLSSNRSQELLRSQLLATLSEEMVDLYMPDYPYDEKPTIMTRDDIPASGSMEDVIADVEAGIIGVNPQFVGNINIGDGFLLGSGPGVGSNNWAVSGDKSASGHALLANDPHLGIAMPSNFYEIGLYCQPVTDDCPYTVRGFSFSPSPLVIIGHNEHIAWGVTTNNWDTQDLYRITVNPDNPLQYLYNGEWRDMTVHDEIIRFGDGAEPITIQVRETHFGPILTDNTYDAGTVGGFVNDGDVYALRWASFEASRLIEAGRLYNKAQNFTEFREALQYWTIASQNFVYADVEGNIGMVIPGLYPVRVAGHTGRLPVDGSTDEFEWLGFIPYEYTPTIYNPERGYIQSANQLTAPPEFYEYLRDELTDTFGDDAEYRSTYEPRRGYRAERIVELLEAVDAHTPETFRAIQADNRMIAAEDLAPYLAELDMGDDDDNAWRDWMLAWDYQLDADSAQAALFMHVWGALMENIYRDEVGDLWQPDVSARMLTTITLLDMPDNAWWDDMTTDDTEDRDTILRESFRDGLANAQAALGDNRESWAWGDVHTATFVNNPLGVSGVAQLENFVNIRDIRTSGGASIVNATSWGSTTDFSVRAVPAMRMIVDMGDFDNNTSILTTGQSSHPMSPHYADMVEQWSRIQANPMRFTREQIEADQAARLMLQPLDTDQ